MAIKLFASRAEAEASTVDESMIWIGSLAYRKDPLGTALATADGNRWSPAGDTTYAHWGAITSDGRDDTAALLAANTWAAKNVVSIKADSGVYDISGQICRYDADENGAGQRLEIEGSGAWLTIFKLNKDISEPIFHVSGSDTSYTGPRATFWEFDGFSIQGNGYKGNAFLIEAAHHIDFRDIAVHNLRGHALDARQLWDSVVDLVATKTGLDGSSSDAAAVRFDYLFDNNISASASNNIWFPRSFQIEESPGLALYWGPGTRKMLFEGKLHGDNNTVSESPHLVVDGGYANIISGANITAADGVAIRFMSSDVRFPNFGNIITNSSIETKGEIAIDATIGWGNSFTQNFIRSSQYAVVVTDGDKKASIVSGNVGPFGKEFVSIYPYVVGNDPIPSSLPDTTEKFVTRSSGATGVGSDSNDRIVSMGDNQTLFGFEGADRFVFRDDGLKGAHKLLDYNPSDDVIIIRSSFSDLKFVNIADSGVRFYADGDFLFEIDIDSGVDFLRIDFVNLLS